MRVPVAWLRDFVQSDAPLEAIAQALTARGFAVGSIEKQPLPGGIVIGSVERLERHPNADRLHVGSVNVGTQTLQIVTGADNVSAGDRVPVALPGAVVFSGAGPPGRGGATKTIAKSSLRGVPSEGMMCSAGELALPGEFEDGILIMEAQAAVGQDFWKAARYGDGVLDVEVPSNRADCLSIVGLAREAAAGLGAEFHAPVIADSAGAEPSPIGVEIADPAVCRQLLGQYFSGLRQGRSPMWMRLRLHAAGMRSHNYLVDVSNYVQIETGQPLHFYDASLLRGAKIIARSATAGEAVTTLDGVRRELPAGTPVIADGSRVIGIAGIFGGAEAAVGERTTQLFLESPTFVGARVRRAAIALGLRTEGASRHERNLPLELAEVGRRRASQLLAAAGARASAVVAAGEKPGKPQKIKLRPQRVNALLGTNYETQRMLAALKPLGITPSTAQPQTKVPPAGGDGAVCLQLPWWRTDLSGEADVIEEIARCIGYDSIPEARACAAPQEVDDSAFVQETYVAHRFAAFGYVEVVSLSLQGTRTAAAWERTGLPFWPQLVNVVNPLSDEQRFLRPSLLPGLLNAAARQQQAQPARFAIFEIGHVFTPREDGATERQTLGALAVYNGTQSGPSLDRCLLEVKGEGEALTRELAGRNPASRAAPAAYLHPGAGAAFYLGELQVGTFGRLHPRLAAAFDLPEHAYYLELFLDRLPARRPTAALQPLAKFPGTKRDLAVVVDEDMAAGDLIAAVAAAPVPALQSITAFDEYRGPQVGPGRKSIALQLDLRLADATITDAQADSAVERVLAVLRSQFDAKLRS